LLNQCKLRNYKLKSIQLPRNIQPDSFLLPPDSGDEEEKIDEKVEGDAPLVHIVEKEEEMIHKDHLRRP